MSISAWLRACLTPRHTPPPAAQAPAEAVDNTVRMHIAASDPSFPAKREAAVATITAAIDVVAARHGFVKKARSWAKTGPLGTITLHLQRSRYGFDCSINLGFQPDSEHPTGPWAEDDFIPLARFMPGNSAPDDAGGLIYLDINDDPTNLTAAMTALDSRALPWLLVHLTDPRAALIDPKSDAPSLS